MALQMEEDNACAGCGHPRDESMAPSAEGQYTARLVACHACAERSKKQADLHEGNADHGLHVAVTRNT